MRTIHSTYLLIFVHYKNSLLLLLLGVIFFQHLFWKIGADVVRFYLDLHQNLICNKIYVHPLLFLSLTKEGHTQLTSNLESRVNRLSKSSCLVQHMSCNLTPIDYQKLFNKYKVLRRTKVSKLDLTS